MLGNILIALVAALHLYFMYLEMVGVRMRRHGTERSG